MHRVSTPPFTFELPIQTSICTQIQVTCKQRDIQFLKHYKDGIVPSGMTLDGKNVTIKLTQEDTKSLVPKVPMDTQVRVLTNSGDVYASQVFSVPVFDVLNEEILSDG